LGVSVTLDHTNAFASSPYFARLCKRLPAALPDPPLAAAFPKSADAFTLEAEDA
jgi:hypothetical protein